MRLREDVGNAHLVPGSRWLVRYQDDLDWWHERVFAWPITNTRWVVRTFDGDQYDENLGDYERMEAMDNSGRYPDGVVQVVSFSRRLAQEEMQECVRDGRAEGERIRAAERLFTPQEPTVMVDWWGSEEVVPGNSWIGGAWRRIRGEQVVQRPTSEVGGGPQPDPEGSFPRRSAPTLASPVVESEGGMWLVCESSGTVG